MRFTYILLALMILPGFLCAQPQTNFNEYEPSDTYPYGQLNPNAPTEIGDFSAMIGLCDCNSISRNPDGSWQDTTAMEWRFKYVLNGTAVQDEVWRESNYASSIRQYHSDSAQWIVSYYSFPSVAYNVGVWRGGKEGDEIVLHQTQKAPNGMDGFSRLTFYDMTASGFKWKGEWVKDDGSFTYPFWSIDCVKRE